MKETSGEVKEWINTISNIQVGQPLFTLNLDGASWSFLIQMTDLITYMTGANPCCMIRSSTGFVF